MVHDKPGPRCQTYHTAGEADATQPRADIVPHSNAAPSDALSHCELEEEQRDADQYQQDEIGHQVSSCHRMKKKQTAIQRKWYAAHCTLVASHHI